MTEEPEAMQEIHRIRLAIYEETKDLSLHEKLELIKKRAAKEWKRIQGMCVAEEKKEYGKKD